MPLYVATRFQNQYSTPIAELLQRTIIGSGVPPAGAALYADGSAPRAGDIWMRIDTPGTVNQRMYYCTVSGPAAAWTALAI